jgi:hypothetical protein
MSCEIPGSMLSSCSRCSGFCTSDVFMYNDRVFCSVTCRQGKRDSGESRTMGKLRRRPSTNF